MFQFEIEEFDDLCHVIEKTIDDAGDILWTIIIRITATRREAEAYIEGRTS